MRTVSWLLVAVLSAGCGGSSSPGPSSGIDASAADGGLDDGGGSAADGSTATDGGGGGDASGTCSAGCAPTWCGCGKCDVAQIVCTSNPPACPLGCASECAEIDTVQCACEADRCVRVGAKPGDPTACYINHDCPVGQCCVATGGIIAGRCAPDGDPGCAN